MREKIFNPDRSKTLKKLRSLGIEPYPYSYPVDTNIHDVLANIETLIILRWIHGGAKPLCPIIVLASNDFKKGPLSTNVCKIEQGYYWCNVQVGLFSLLRIIDKIKHEIKLRKSTKYPIAWVKLLLLNLITRKKHSMQNNYLLFMEEALRQFTMTASEQEVEMAKKLCRNKVLAFLNELDFIIGPEYRVKFGLKNLPEWKNLLISFCQTEDMACMNVEKVQSIIIELSKSLEGLKILAEA